MPAEQRQVVKIFLASPSDLAAERVIAKEIVDKINARWANFLSLQIELVGWEDSVSVYGRPQDTINQDLARCEFFIGMLWHEWGKPNGRYESGFEEEFRLSEKGLQETGRPAINLLFKDMDQSRFRDAGPGLTRVLKFKDEVKGKILYKTFGNEGEFRERFESVVTDYIQGLKLAEQTQPVQEAPIADATVPGGDASPQEGDHSQLPSAAVKFIRHFASRAEKDLQTEPVDVVEVARFRLIGTLVRQQGNDDTLLGVHDANVLYADGGDLPLTLDERSALLGCGLAHFDSENVPYWKWLSSTNELHFETFAYRTVTGTDTSKVGALKLMRLMELTMPYEQNLRSHYLSLWLAPATSQAERKAALQYLGEFGSATDLKPIRDEIDRADYQTASAAIHAYAAIRLKESADKALEALLELQPESIETNLLDRVFAKPQVLSSSLLDSSLAHKAPQLRARAAATLVARKALSSESAETLTTDADPEVRLQGLLGKLGMGEKISEQAARAVLVSNRAKRSLLGALSWGSPPTEGEAQFERFKISRLRGLTMPELRRESAANTPLEQKYRFEEIRRSFSANADELRANLLDGFASRFNEIVRDLGSAINNPETIQKVQDVEDSLRKEWTREALNIIVAKGRCEDLPAVRKALTTGLAACNEVDIEFLAKCGEWEDIATILSFSKSDRAGLTLLGSYRSPTEISKLSKALLSIAKNRERDLLSQSLDSRIRASILEQMPAKAFRKVSSDEFMALLQSSDDTIRRVTALKGVMTFSKARVRTLLAEYLSLPTSRYYNVIVWLDLGVSIEHSQAVSIAKRAIGWRSGGLALA